MSRSISGGVAAAPVGSFCARSEYRREDVERRAPRHLLDLRPGVARGAEVVRKRQLVEGGPLDEVREGIETIHRQCPFEDQSVQVADEQAARVHLAAAHRHDQEQQERLPDDARELGIDGRVAAVREQGDGVDRNLIAPVHQPARDLVAQVLLRRVERFVDRHG